MSLLKTRLDMIWNRPGVAFPCHKTGWSIVSPPSYEWLYGILNIRATRNRMTFPRTEGQKIQIAYTRGRILYKPYCKWLGRRR